MTTRTNFAVVKSIQFRIEVVNDQGGVLYGWNKHYRSAHAAAKYYAQRRLAERQDEKWKAAGGLGYHQPTAQDQKYAKRLHDRFFRVVLRKFKEILE